MKKLLIIFFAMGSFSVSADCVQMYKDAAVSGGIQAAAMYVTVIGIPLGIYNSYFTHQARKMRDLIKEAKARRVGKRTKGLMKSLNGLMSSKSIHKKVLLGNKKGKFCKWVPDPNSRLGQSISLKLYRDFKNELRFLIDQNRISKGKNPIWNDADDLVVR